MCNNKIKSKIILIVVIMLLVNYMLLASDVDSEVLEKFSSILEYYVYYSIVLILMNILVFLIVYEYFYFKSCKFNDIKLSIIDHINDCNELNKHINELKKSKITFNREFGIAQYNDSSNYNFKRSNWKNIKYEENVYRCSANVCRGAQEHPFKYFCKYFNVNHNEKTLNDFEEMFNNFLSVESGKHLLLKERERVYNLIIEKIPTYFRKFRSKKVIAKLGFEQVDINQFYFPEFYFQYVSAGGNSTMSVKITFSIENLERFIIYLASEIERRKTIVWQRSLITNKVREEIKKRDCFCCKKCGISIEKEPHLLLEIDHIIPLSKGGTSELMNLQTLCWRCNRTKGNKLET